MKSPRSFERLVPVVSLVLSLSACSSDDIRQSNDQWDLQEMSDQKIDVSEDMGNKTVEDLGVDLSDMNFNQPDFSNPDTGLDIDMAPGCPVKFRSLTQSNLEIIPGSADRVAHEFELYSETDKTINEITFQIDTLNNQFQSQIIKRAKLYKIERGLEPQELGSLEFANNSDFKMTNLNINLKAEEYTTLELRIDADQISPDDISKSFRIKASQVLDCELDEPSARNFTFFRQGSLFVDSSPSNQRSITYDGNMDNIVYSFDLIAEREPVEVETFTVNLISTEGRIYPINPRSSVELNSPFGVYSLDKNNAPQYPGHQFSDFNLDFVIPDDNPLNFQIIVSSDSDIPKGDYMISVSNFKAEGDITGNTIDEIYLDQRLQTTPQDQTDISATRTIE